MGIFIALDVNSFPQLLSTLFFFRELGLENISYKASKLPRFFYYDFRIESKQKKPLHATGFTAYVDRTRLWTQDKVLVGLKVGQVS